MSARISRTGTLLTTTRGSTTTFRRNSALSEWAGDQATVEFNQTRVGKFSGVPRQIDILISGRFAGVTDRDITAAVDCKFYTSNITVDGVDRMIGFIEDVQADLGLLITNQGFSPGAWQRASRGIHLRVIPANIDQLPPPYHPASDEPYYASEYWESGYGRPDGFTVEFWQLDPDALEYSFDPDSPPEWTTEPVLTGATDEVSWSTDAGRAACMRAVLAHRNGAEEPPVDDVKLAVRELAYHWEDGYPWVLYAGQLSVLGL